MKKFPYLKTGPFGNPIFSETCEYEVPTNFGADYSPRTPEVVSQRKVLPEDEPIVSKVATLIQKTEEESKKVIYFRVWLIRRTVAINELLWLKNAGA